MLKSPAEVSSLRPGVLNFRIENDTMKTWPDFVNALSRIEISADDESASVGIRFLGPSPIWVAQSPTVDRQWTCSVYSTDDRKLDRNGTPQPDNLDFGTLVNGPSGREGTGPPWDPGSVFMHLDSVRLPNPGDEILPPLLACSAGGWTAGSGGTQILTIPEIRITLVSNGAKLDFDKFPERWTCKDDVYWQLPPDSSVRDSSFALEQDGRRITPKESHCGSSGGGGTDKGGASITVFRPAVAITAASQPAQQVLQLRALFGGALIGVAAQLIADLLSAGFMAVVPVAWVWQNVLSRRWRKRVKSGDVL
ncbi:hypothetical protein [Actinoplanes sp. NPDC051411]|uniref:hypothetical protein n=1 Tax=Actinoplanes sp. NPDC051411 TaxID=3155522 RepID=UPI003443D1BA